MKAVAILVLATISTLLLANGAIAQENQGSLIADTIASYISASTGGSSSASGQYPDSETDEDKQPDGFLTSFLTGPVINSFVKTAFNTVEVKLNTLLTLRRILSYENIRACLLHLRKFLNLVLRFCTLINLYLPEAQLDTNGLGALVSTYPSKLPDGPAKPSSEYGVPAIPTNEYGVPAKPSNEYGVPAKPTTHYGVPDVKPSNEYGVPAKPSNEYGVPTEPSSGYGVPTEKFDIYSFPPNTHFELKASTTSQPEVPAGDDSDDERNLYTPENIRVLAEKLNEQPSEYGVPANEYAVPNEVYGIPNHDVYKRPTVTDYVYRY